jgi:hypothetical protein
MLGHGTVTTTIRYLGLKEENLTQAGELLASKYSAPVEDRAKPVQSVPESVPTIPRIDVSKNKESDCKIE